MEIREITKKDNLGVKELIQSSLKELGFDKPGTAYYDPELNDLTYFYHSTPKAMYWVIEVEGKIVGGVGIAPFKDNICELQKLYVSPKIQGKGLARLLMDKALTFASEHYEACYLETHSELDAACKLYEKYDFESLSKPIEGSEHSAMDKWYLKRVSQN